MEHRFKTGDVVRLKGGDQRMVVQRATGIFAETGLESTEDGTPCQWIDKQGRPQGAIYDAVMLVLCEPESE